MVEGRGSRTSQSGSGEPACLGPVLPEADGVGGERRRQAVLSPSPPLPAPLEYSFMTVHGPRALGQTVSGAGDAVGTRTVETSPPSALLPGLGVPAVTRRPGTDAMRERSQVPPVRQLVEGSRWSWG